MSGPMGVTSAVHPIGLLVSRGNSSPARHGARKLLAGREPARGALEHCDAAVAARLKHNARRARGPHRQPADELGAHERATP